MDFNGTDIMTWIFILYPYGFYLINYSTAYNKSEYTFTKSYGRKERI